MNNKGADQTARLHRLVSAFVVRKTAKAHIMSQAINKTGHIFGLLQIIVTLHLQGKQLVLKYIYCAHRTNTVERCIQPALFLPPQLMK